MPETDAWPAWQPPEDLHRLERDGYNHVSRYVVPAVLAEFHGQAFPVGTANGVAGVEEVWQALVDHEIRYTNPLYHPGTTQRIRPPSWLLRKPVGDGTCIEFAALFAAACHNRGYQAWLVMIRDAKVGHVGVAVRIGGQQTELPFGAEPTQEHGVLVVPPGAEEDLIADDQVLLLDLTTAAFGSVDQTLETSQEALAAAVRNPDNRVHLIDFVARHRLGGADAQLGRGPQQPGALGGRIPALPSGWRRFASRSALQNDIATAAGSTVVLLGRPGLGKSQLAQAAAAEADEGFGWFLAGESSVALDADLAAHEAVERGLDPGTTSDPETRKAFAGQARARLAGRSGRWVVVIDNVDTGLKERAASLPTPHGGQVLIITSTASRADWEDALSGRTHTIHELEPLTTAEATDLAGLPSTLAPIVDRLGGNPLILVALAKLGGDHLDDLVGRLDGADSDETVAGVLVHQVVTLAEGSREALAELALLPADRIPRAQMDAAVADGLIALGVVVPRGTTNLSLHRLFGQALREQLATELSAAAVRLLSDPDLVRYLIVNGDAVNTAYLAAAVADTGDGVALCGLAAIQEMFDRPTSSTTYLAAREFLDESDPSHGPALADAFHGEARDVNMGIGFKGLTEEQRNQKRRDAVEMMRRALSLRAPDDLVGRAKTMALQSLLRRALASTIEDPVERLREYESIRDDLELSYRQRQEALGDRDPLVDRALFNLAGVHLQLAKSDRPNWENHLANCRDVYDRTRAFRLATYQDPHELIAASTVGIAMHEYHRAWFLPAGTTPEDRGANLAGAALHAVESLDMRKRGRSGDGPERASAQMLAKIGALQFALANGTFASLAKEIERELGDIPGLVDEN